MLEKERISKYRTPIMGFAAIWIMLFHSTINVPMRAIDTVIKIGYLGVDIFMFMSGFSMWNSFCVSCRGNGKEFIYRRFKKIFPTFIPFAILWITSYLINNYKSTNELIEAMHTKDFWITIIIFRWFVPCIILCYLITPIINAIFNRFGYKIQTLLVLIAICIGISMPFVYLKSSLALMVILRIPEYIIGWYYGAAASKTKNHILTRVAIIVFMYAAYYCLLGTFSDEYLSDTGLYWWPAIVCVSSMVICLARCRYIDNKIFNFCGKYSLELYLWHVFFMFSIIDFLSKHNLEIDKYGIFVNVISVVFACAISFLYSKIISFFMKKVGT